MSTKFRPAEGMIGFTYDTELAAHPLDCEIEHEPEERGDSESPGYPAVYRLCSVAICGIDITGLVSDKLFRAVIVTGKHCLHWYLTRSIDSDQVNQDHAVFLSGTCDDLELGHSNIKKCKAC